MSLLHQVLRDIDQRRGDAAAQLPPLLRETAAAPPATARSSWWLLLAALVPVLALIWVAQPQRLLPAAEPVSAPVMPPVLDPEVQEIAEPTTESTTEPATATEPPALPVSQPVAAATTTIATNAEPVPAEPEPGSEPALAVIPPAAPATVTPEPAPAAALVAPAEPQPPLIIRTGAEARQWYQQALAAARQQRWDEANRTIEQALRLDNQDDYAALQLRIWLQQQRRDDFIRYYRQEQSRTALSWLAVAAPGLHLLGFVPEAIAAYEQLLQQQPQPQWSLALASALRDNGQPQRARAILQRIPTAQLTPAQQRWIEQILSEPQS